MATTSARAVRWGSNVTLLIDDLPPRAPRRLLGFAAVRVVAGALGPAGVSGFVRLAGPGKGPFDERGDVRVQGGGRAVGVSVEGEPQDLAVLGGLPFPGGVGGPG